MASTVVNTATYYSAPGDGDTIQLEAHALVSPNPMYESVDVPTRHAYEEVHDFETKAVPNGNDDVALYSYVPPTVSLAGTHTVYLSDPVCIRRHWGDHRPIVFSLSHLGVEGEQAGQGSC